MEKWNYPVILREIQAKDDNNPLVKNRMACVAGDTGEVLGLVSKRYKLIQNKTLYEVMENLGSQLGLKLTQVHICKNRTLTSFQYSFGEKYQTVVEGSSLDNDIIQFGVEAINTFDGLGGLPRSGIRFNAKRLVCLNGMSLLKEFARINFNELDNFENPLALKEIMVNKIDKVLEQVNIWKEWTRFTPSRLKINEFIFPLFSKKKSLELVGKYDDGADKTLWGLYNLITAYITHELKSRNLDNLRLKQLGASRIENLFYVNEWK
jgi:hypothetical protein